MLLAWVLFRCDTWEQARGCFIAMADLGSLPTISTLPWRALAPDVLFAFGAGMILCAPTAAWMREQVERLPLARLALPPLATTAALAVLALSLLAVGAGSHNPFIYFRF